MKANFLTEFHNFLIAFVEPSPNADLTQVSWDSGPSFKAAGGAKQMTSSPNHMLYISFECRSLFHSSAGFCGLLHCNLTALLQLPLITNSVLITIFRGTL